MIDQFENSMKFIFISKIISIIYSNLLFLYIIEYISIFIYYLRENLVRNKLNITFYPQITENGYKKFS